jgi:hypothetical protein
MYCAAHPLTGQPPFDAIPIARLYGVSGSLTEGLYSLYQQDQSMPYNIMSVGKAILR